MYRFALSLITIMGLSFSTATIESRGATPSPGKVLNSDVIAKEIGLNGESKGDVYRISLPRTDLTVMLEGVKLRPGFALGTWIAFKGIGEDAVAHGDLVLTESEVGPVVAQLEREGIHITGLHNHLVHESPHVMYLHFWGKGEAARLARSLKNTLNLTKTPITQSKSGQGDEAFPQAESILKILGHRGEVKGGILKVSISRPESIKMMGVELPRIWAWRRH